VLAGPEIKHTHFPFRMPGRHALVDIPDDLFGMTDSDAPIVVSDAGPLGLELRVELQQVPGLGQVQGTP